MGHFKPPIVDMYGINPPERDNKAAEDIFPPRECPKGDKGTIIQRLEDIETAFVLLNSRVNSIMKDLGMIK